MSDVVKTVFRALLNTSRMFVLRADFLNFAR